MYDASYYRGQAKRARRLYDTALDDATQDALASAAKDFDEIAEDLERGAVEIRHPELMPQTERAAAEEDSTASPPGRVLP